MTKDEAKQNLLSHLTPGDHVYTILRHVSKSGMLRLVDAYMINADGPTYLNGYIEALTGIRRDKQGRLKMGGCGYDVGHEIVYCLSHTLWPKGFGCIGERCPSNDHSNGDRSRVLHGLFDETGYPENRDPYPGEALDGCQSHWHNEGGYALRREWM